MARGRKVVEYDTNIIVRCSKGFKEELEAACSVAEISVSELIREFGNQFIQNAKNNGLLKEIEEETKNECL